MRVMKYMWWWKMKKTKLKTEFANKLLQSGIKPYSVVRHSYTNNRLSGKKDIDTVQNTDTDLCPTLDTRCDCLAVVVLENKNGNKN